MNTNLELNRWLKACGSVGLAWALAGTFSARADAPKLPDPTIKVPARTAFHAYAFDLGQVRLLDGPLARARDLNQKYMRSLDPDRLLHTFRLNAGLPSTAAPLGGWEEPKGELRGHFAGHYLTACALMYDSEGDTVLRDNGARVVAGMAECQKKLGGGYLSAYPETFFDRVEKQQQVWAPYYTLHKILAGLIDMHVHCGNAQALDVAERFAGWVIARNSRLTDEQMQRMLGNEHGGMNESLAILYGITGKPEYLAIAQRFNHKSVMGPASQRQDKLTHLHANTQIPKFIGAARQHELTGEEWSKTAATFFWDTVVKERSYVIGGHSDGEMFSPKETLSKAFGPSTTETCNTYNMLKLTRHLFCWEPRAEYADYYERALFNHILSSQNPETGMMCYYVPLRSGSHKEYNTPEHSFWCCTGTGVENHAKYGDSIYFHDGGTNLYWNLFVASELNWEARGVKIRQETAFPDQGASKLVFKCARPVSLALNVRRPAWAVEGFQIKIGGRAVETSAQPGGFVTLARVWQDGDTVELVMPFSLRTEGFRDNPARMAFLNGPVVLGMELKPGVPAPALVGAKADVLSALKPVAGRPSTFEAPAALFRVPGGKSAGALVLEPFYKIHGKRSYAVYFDQFTPERWQDQEKAYEARQAAQRELDARRVDQVNPGEEQNERDHAMKGEKTNAGGFGDRKYRHATDGGWFSWELKVQKDRPQTLRVTYWGDDGGGRVFDILVNDTKLATQTLNRNKPGQFFEESYRLPETLTQGREKVTVKFQARPGGFAGGVFGVALLKD